VESGPAASDSRTRLPLRGIDNKRHAIPSRDDGSLKALQGSITMRGLQNDVRVANRTASRKAGACLLPESVAYCCTHRAGDPLP